MSHVGPRKGCPQVVLGPGFSSNSNRTQLLHLSCPAATQPHPPLPASSLSACLCRKAVNVIGNGVVVHVPSLFEEVEELEKKGVDVSKKRVRGCWEQSVREGQ